MTLLLHSVPQVLYNNSLLSLIYKWTGEVTILDINKHINSSIKKYILFISLGRVRSYEYYYDESYRQYIKNLLHNIKRQLQINLEFNYFKNVNAKDDGLINLQSLNFLDLSSNGYIENVNVLNNCHSLKLFNCQNISNVSALGNLHYLDISFCRLVSDVSMLGNLNTLKLKDCTGIKNFSVFLTFKVCYLNLSNTLISDTNDLRKVKKLILNNCDYLADISSLKTNKELEEVSIVGNKHISDISSLSNVPTVRIGGMPKIVDVCSLEKVQKLVISDCNMISDVSKLAKIPNLTLIDLINLEDISSLGDHDKLCICKCGNYSEQSQFRQITHLSKVRNCLLIGKEMVRYDKNVILFLKSKVRDFELI